MGFADIIFLFYIILGLLGLYLLWQWLLGENPHLDIAPEKRGLITLVVIMLAGLIWLSYAFKLNHWRHNNTTFNPVATTNNSDSILAEDILNQPEEKLTEEQKLARFEQENFSELYDNRTSLYRDIKGLDAFFVKIKQFAPSVPKQIPLLNRIYQLRQETYKRYSQRYLEVSQQLRNFWVHYSTGNSENTLQKFQPVVTRLIQDIQQTRGDDIDNQAKQAQYIIEAMRAAETMLKSNKLPTAQQGLTSYKPDNRQQIMEWLNKNGSNNVLESLTMLTNQRAHIFQQIQTVKNYIQRYRDLPLGRTLQLWQTALQHNLYAEYRLLYAVEIPAALQQLGIELPVKQSAHLDATLEVQIPNILKFVNEMVTQAEEAYAPTTPKVKGR
ncbi:hypothetical protein [uncultured Thiothrix sp.]|uniref:hypothetical protein n=1 Tax=uncultured Thiothrix sp. TaxID=223185 RepID=UPI00260A5618|nr:hypothetical protein [uncultured Thiothrix sp.]HMT91384.1 hypothetical protein [Thiolinea sp.]